jgi:hypothetical protein
VQAGSDGSACRTNLLDFHFENVHDTALR